MFKSIGEWPELPEAFTNCLVMTQIAGSNFSHAVSSWAGAACSALPAPSVLVVDRAENPPGAGVLL